MAGSREFARAARTLRACAIVVALGLVASACSWLGPPGAGVRPGERAVAPLHHDGRWFTDAFGRVVMLRGTNFVQKAPPYHPAGVGFGDDDAAFLAANGVNAFRLGIEFQALMPEPGRIDHTYVEALAGTVRALARHRIFVVLDFHQDGYGPATHGNGMPAWATFTDGLPNPPVPFPLYYVQNPALQRAFDNFWENRPAADGVGVQDHYANGVRAVAQRFANEPYVVGYDAMNEPWPGTDWTACVTGCPELEQRLLVPFYERVSRAVRSVDRSAYVFAEPFVLFNFGLADTIVPGFDAPRNALSTHVYSTSADGDLAAMRRAVTAAERSRVPLLVTEWGATNDAAVITRTAAQLDQTLVPWTFWAYNENVIIDPARPPTPDNVRGPVVDALTRPNPVATNGTPLALEFDAATGRLDYRYSTLRPDGRRAAGPLETAISMPARSYPGGYVATATGGTVTSPPCARVLTVRADPQAAEVLVHATPRGACPGDITGSFDALAYNVAGLPQEISGENPAVNIPLISPRLEPYDLVLTQEDFDWWQPALDALDFANYHDRLRAQVTHPYRSTRHPGPVAAGLDPSTRPTLLVGDGLGYLSRFPASDDRRVAWKGCFGGANTADGGAGDCLAMKGFAVSTLEPAPGVLVDVYNLHVEAGGTAEDQRLQGDDMGDLATFILEHSAGRAVILGGDTNLHTNSTHPDGANGADTVLWETFLARTGLADVCASLGCPDRHRIDKFAFRSGGGVAITPRTHVFRAAEFTDAAGEALSDHDPLEVRFDWTAHRG
ncbi:MAG: cellulase family glycosylhydrolase [Acidimicrobiia bacterium]